MRHVPVRNDWEDWVQGLARVGLIAFLLPMVAVACGSKKPSTNPSRSPSPIAAPTTPLPSLPVTSPSPSHPVGTLVSPSPSAKPSPSPVTNTAVPPVTATVQINAASGSTMTAKVGQILSLTLGQDPGSAWNFVTLPNSGVLSIVNQQSFLPSPVPPGVTEEFRVTFKAESAGTTGFALNEVIGSAPPALAYSVTVTVTS